MIGALGCLGALDTLGLEAPQVGFISGDGGASNTSNLQTDAGVNLQTDSGVQLQTDQ
jgi:hypothetical protein